MSFYFNNIKPEYEAEDGGDGANNSDQLNDILRQETSDEDSDYNGADEEDEDGGLSKVAFGFLKKAQDDYNVENRKNNDKKSKKLAEGSVLKDVKKEMQKMKEMKKAQQQPKIFKEESFDEDSSDDSEGLFEEEERLKQAARDQKSRNVSNSRPSNNINNRNQLKKKSNHAPSEQSSKKRVSVIRDVPGLEINKKYKESATYEDVRFDKSLGKSDDFNMIRSRYKFLDEYRDQEIKELEKRLKDKKYLSKISESEKYRMEESLRRMKSKLQSLKNRDLENEIVKKYTDEINNSTKNKFYLKESDKRKIINKYKFDHMRAGQREKVMERKRKKQLGKEMRQFEFNN